MESNTEEVLLKQMIQFTSHMDRHETAMRALRCELEELMGCDLYTNFHNLGPYSFQKKLDEKYKETDIMDSSSRNKFGLFLFDLLKELKDKDEPTTKKS